MIAETNEPPPEAPAGPESELARAQARIADLSREVALLRTPTEPPVPGKRVVGVLFLIIALALSTAFGIWAFARKPWAEKKLPPPPPAAAVVDEAGRAIVLALQSCVSAVPETEPVSIKLRVKIGGDGSTAVVEANVQPALEVLVPCARQSASAFHPARGDRDYDVLVLYEATREPTYRRMARWNWTVVEMNNSRLGLALRLAPGFRGAVGSGGGWLGCAGDFTVGACLAAVHVAGRSNAAPAAPGLFLRQFAAVCRGGSRGALRRRTGSLRHSASPLLRAR